MMPKNITKNRNLYQGREVFWSASTGLLIGLIPLLLLVNTSLRINLVASITLSVLWILGTGTLMTYWFSSALHKRINELKPELTKGLQKGQKNKKGPPTRLPWIPFWLGIFERILFALLIGFSIDGTGTLIVAWIGAKLASGWGTWSAGEAYGRAIFFAGFLGSALSLLFGVSAGLILRGAIATIGQ